LGRCSSVDGFGSKNNQVLKETIELEDGKWWLKIGEKKHRRRREGKGDRMQKCWKLNLLLEYWRTLINIYICNYLIVKALNKA
jgi:hypothetical protein